MFKYFKLELIEEITNARSKISISFNRQGSKREKISVIGVITHFINSKYEMYTRLLGLLDLPNHSKTSKDEASVILLLLTRFGISTKNLGGFVLDNVSNNDTTL